MKFHYWKVITKNKDKSGYWFCRCACGTERSIFASDLKRGKSKSCGCYNLEVRTTHGLKHSREYNIWRHMKYRCSITKTKGFEYYGGRGIDIKWQSFEDFFADMGPSPTPRHSIDRIDNNGPYSKENCRWATQEQQQNNKRSNVFYEFKGERTTLAILAKKYSINYQALWKRIKKYGWSLEKALTTPTK